MSENKIKNQFSQKDWVLVLYSYLCGPCDHKAYNLSLKAKNESLKSFSSATICSESVKLYTFIYSNYLICITMISLMLSSENIILPSTLTFLLVQHRVN